MNRLLHRLNRQVFRRAALGLFCGLISWLVSLHPLCRGLEEWLQDECLVNRGNRHTDARLVIVALDDASIAELPRPLTFLSPEFSELIQDFDRRGVKAIGLDLTIPEDLDKFPGLEGDRLGVAAASTEKVVMPIFDVADRVIRPLKGWRAGAALLGLVSLTPDDDHFLRRQQLASRVGGEDYYQFAVALLKVAGRVDDEQPDGRLRVNGRVVPDDGRGRMRVNFVGPAGSIDRIPFRVALAAARGGPPPSVDLDGTIVIIGATAAYLGDSHVTPYANGALLRLWTRPNGLMSGPEFQANVVATLSDGAFLITPWWLSTPIVVPAIGMALGVMLAQMSLARGAVLATAHHFGWKLAALLGLWLASWRIEMVAMLLTGASCYAIHFALRWRWLRRTFGAMKSREVLQALEDDPDGLNREGQERELTVLFADIRNFTAFSENKSPRRIVALLNEYFGAIVPIVDEHGGTVDKYIGDGLMVLFGAPRDQQNHALQAVRAAIAMVELVHDLDETWARHEFPRMRIGVGVHTGTAVVGVVGSSHRLDYTAHGDTINAASRIEAETKPLKAEILISEATYQALAVRERSRLDCVEEPEPRTVKGKKDVLQLHRVLVPRGEPWRRSEAESVDRGFVDPQQGSDGVTPGVETQDGVARPSG
jgi:adenylate cyclase